MSAVCKINYFENVHLQIFLDKGYGDEVNDKNFIIFAKKLDELRRSLTEEDKIEHSERLQKINKVVLDVCQVDVSSPYVHLEAQLNLEYKLRKFSKNFNHQVKAISSLIQVDKDYDAARDKLKQTRPELQEYRNGIKVLDQINPGAKSTCEEFYSDIEWIETSYNELSNEIDKVNNHQR